MTVTPNGDQGRTKRIVPLAWAARLVGIKSMQKRPVDRSLGLGLAVLLRKVGVGGHSAV